MTAPAIVITASGQHLANADASRTVCGEPVGRPFALLPLEPGADLGDGPRDCPKCVALWRGEVRP